ncbi:MAG TPA: hypothetical protein VJX73_14885 [Terracidiphilus sp.]|nr:hypothetical protein [Terracidiphilus sp.]
MAPDPKIEGLEAWDVDVRETSMCVYAIRAVRSTGNIFEKSGVNEGEVESTIDELREFELTIQQAIRQRKLGARG